MSTDSCMKVTIQFALTRFFVLLSSSFEVVFVAPGQGKGIFIFFTSCSRQITVHH